MSNKWEKVSSKTSGTDEVLHAVTLGFYPVERETTVRNTDTGETGTVRHFTDSGLGEKIADGKIKMDDDD